MKIERACYSSGWHRGRSVHRYGLIPMHTGPDGGPVLRGQSSWRTVCGVMISTKWGRIWWCWR